jgi:diacylglycerol kinase
MQNEPFSIKKRLKSFVYAFNGIKILIRDEHNARIHLLATIFVIVLGFYLNISTPEWIAVLFAIGFVFAMEMTNSAIENLCDFASPEKHETIKKVKDLAAGAVLLSAVSALIIGLIIFIPKIFNF